MRLTPAPLVAVFTSFAGCVLLPDHKSDATVAPMAPPPQTTSTSTTYVSVDFGTSPDSGGDTGIGGGSHGGGTVPPMPAPDSGDSGGSAGAGMRTARPTAGLSPLPSAPVTVSGGR